MIDGNKVLGIIGGMGPLATAEIYRRIVLLTDARYDREHIHIIIDGNPHVPDRTASILAGSDAPLEQLLASARRLGRMGADLLLMGCNSAHHFYDRVSAGSGVPVVNMVDLAAARAAEMGCGTVGLLGVDGTLRSGVFDAALRKRGIQVLKPGEEDQKKVMRLIYDEVKAGRAPVVSALDGVLERLSDRGAEGFILGCTELSPAYPWGTDKPLIDPVAAAALCAIRTLGYRVREGSVI